MKKLIILTLITTASVVTSYASIDKNLKYGQRDKEVTELQEFLIDKGLLKTTPSNFFGLLTLKAVKAYQTSVGVTPTGFVGVLTREKINKEIESEVASSNEAERAESTVSVNTPQTNTQSIANNQNTTNSDDSVYDTNTKIDTLGRKIIITQDPNYKFLNIVRAKVDTGGGKVLTGFFYKNTKIFMTEENISQQQAITDEIMKKKGDTPVIQNDVHPQSPIQTTQQPILVNGSNFQSYAPSVLDKKNIKIFTSSNGGDMYGAILKFTTNQSVFFNVELFDTAGNNSSSYYVYVTDPDGVKTRLQQPSYTFSYNLKKAGQQIFIFDVPELGLKKEVAITVDQFVSVPPTIELSSSKDISISMGAQTNPYYIPIASIKIDGKNNGLFVKELKYSIVSNDLSATDVPLRMANIIKDGSYTALTHNDVVLRGGFSIEILPHSLKKTGSFRIRIDKATVILNPTDSGNLNENNFDFNVSGLLSDEIKIIP